MKSGTLRALLVLFTALVVSPAAAAEWIVETLAEAKVRVKADSGKHVLVYYQDAKS